QLPIEPPRQVVPDQPQRVLYHHEVLDEPFRGRGDGAALADDPCESQVAPEQNTAVVPDSRPQRPSTSTSGHGQFGCEAQSPGLEVLGAQRVAASGVSENLPGNLYTIGYLIPVRRPACSSCKFSLSR